MSETQPDAERNERTQTVEQNGMVYVGREYAGDEVELTIQRTDPNHDQEGLVRDGFDQFPPQLLGATTIVAECGTEAEPGFGCGWSEEYDVDPADVSMKADGLLTLPEAVATKCTECGNRYLFKYNGVEVCFDV